MKKDDGSGWRFILWYFIGALSAKIAILILDSKGIL